MICNYCFQSNYLKRLYNRRNDSQNDFELLMFVRIPKNLTNEFVIEMTCSLIFSKIDSN